MGAWVQDSRDFVTDLKFSGDGALLALASQARRVVACVRCGALAPCEVCLQDTKVYIYNVRDNAGSAPLPGARAATTAVIRLRYACPAFRHSRIRA